MKEKLDVNNYLHMTQEEFTEFICSEEALMKYEMSTEDKSFTDLVVDFIIAKNNLDLNSHGFELYCVKSEDGLTYTTQIRPCKKGD